MRPITVLRLMLAGLICAALAAACQFGSPQQVAIPSEIDTAVPTVTDLPTMQPTNTMAPTVTLVPTSTRAPVPSSTAAPTSSPYVWPTWPATATPSRPQGPYIHLDYRPDQLIEDFEGVCDYDPNGDHQGEVGGYVGFFRAPDYTADSNPDLFRGTVRLSSNVTGWEETQSVEDGSFRFACLGPETYDIEFHLEFRPTIESPWIPFDNQNEFQSRNKSVYQQVVVQENRFTSYSWIVYFGE